MILGAKFKTALTISLILIFTITVAKSDAEDKIVSPAQKTSKRFTNSQTRGKALILSNNCTVCHTMESKGGCLAPPFDGIAKRRSKEFIMARITADSAEEEKFHRKFQAQELMPHVRIARPHARQIADFLLTLSEPSKGFKIIGHGKRANENSKKINNLIVRLENKETNKQPKASKKDDSLVGKNLVFEKGCLACHSIGNAGGRFAPKLDKVGSRKSMKQIASQILSAELRPQTDNKNAPNKVDKMPASNLSIDEILAISNYLKSLK